MQIEFSFTCRECERANTVRWDTSRSGEVSLACGHCGHASGELVTTYAYRAEHRPSRERESLAGD